MSQLYSSLELTEPQTEAVEHLLQKRKAIVWHKIGLGKTRVAIAWIIANGWKHPLVICSPQAFRQWEDEIDLVQMKDLIHPTFLSYGMLSKGAGSLNKLLERSKIECVVLDELWLYKNPKTKRSEIAGQLSRQFPVIGLSGSMITNKNIEDLYGQARAVGLGENIATSLTNFRTQFCIPVENYAGFLEFLPKKDSVPIIQTRLKNNIHICFPKETREIRNIPIRVDPTEEQLIYKDKLIHDYYVSSKEDPAFELEVKNGATLLLKLQQVSDGFLSDSKGSFLSIKSNKLQRLIQHVQELLDAGERSLVWFAFKHSIQEALRLSTFSTALLYSDEHFDAQAWNRGTARVCYATIGSGSSLNDFASVRYAIIYSSSFSTRAYEQAKGRTNRTSSIQSICWYYHFETLKFPDSYIYKSLRENQKVQEYVINTTRRIVEDWIKEKQIRVRS